MNAPDMLVTADLATVINREHDAAYGKAREAVEHARRCGELLLHAKAKVAHGGWLPWLRDNVRVSPRQAQRYMAAAQGKYDAVSHLSLRRALVALLPEPELPVPAEKLTEVPAEKLTEVPVEELTEVPVEELTEVLVEELTELLIAAEKDPPDQLDQGLGELPGEPQPACPGSASPSLDEGEPIRAKLRDGKPFSNGSLVWEAVRPNALLCAERLDDGSTTLSEWERTLKRGEYRLRNEIWLARSEFCDLLSSAESQVPREYPVATPCGMPFGTIAPKINKTKRRAARIDKRNTKTRVRRDGNRIEADTRNKDEDQP